MGILFTRTELNFKFICSTRFRTRPLGVITEAVKELHEAIEAKDMTETVDGLAEILYVTYRVGTMLIHFV